MVRSRSVEIAQPDVEPVMKSTTMYPSGEADASLKMSTEYTPTMKQIPLASESATLWPNDVSSPIFIARFPETTLRSLTLELGAGGVRLERDVRPVAALAKLECLPPNR